MKSGFLVYKCKRCGDLINATHTPDGIFTICSIITNSDLPREWGGMPVGKEEIHNCKDGNLGVAELIGFEYDQM